VNDFIPGTESFENTNYVNGMQKKAPLIVLSVLENCIKICMYVCIPDK
jgi:hypothetical protein